MRRILAFFLALTMIFSLVPSAFAASITDGDAENMAVALEVDKTTIAAGESVTVTMTVKEEITRVASFDYRLYFDNTKFDLTDKTLGETNAAMEFDAKVMTDRKTGETYFGIGAIDVESTDEGLTIAAGLLCTMTFTAKEDLAEGTYDFRMESKAISDPEWNDMEASGLKAPFTVTIQNKVPVTGVSLNWSEKEIDANGGEFKLSATITPTNATVQDVVWASSDEDVATVDDGLVKAVGAGDCEITATVDGVTATCYVTVYDSSAAFPFTITVGDTDLDPVSDGEEECLYGGILAKWVVTVPADAQSLVLVYDYDSMDVYADDDGDQLCDNAQECTVDLTQGYQFLDIVGNTRNEYYHLYIEVAEPEKIPVTSVGLSETAIEMALNSGVKQLYATVTPDNATNKIVTWTSSDENVVTVVDGGNNMCILYTAGAGEAVITATADGVSASCAVTVYDPATQFPYTLSVNGEDLEVTPNGTTSSCLFGNQSLFDVTVPADATEMQITFDGESMSVMDDSSGKPNILANNVTEYTLDLTKGYVEIHLADNDNNVHRHVRINVAEPETPAVSITLDKTELELSSFAGEHYFTLTVTGADKADVVWASTNEDVAMIYAMPKYDMYVVQGMGPGECDITATVDGVTATCHVVVTDPVLDSFPFTITVDGTDVEAVADGTEMCDYGPRLYKYVVTVPADAKIMHLSYDNESAYIIPDHGDEYLLEGGVDCDVDLTKGYKVLDLWDAEDPNLMIHLHIEYAEPEKIPVTGVALSVSEHTLDAIGGEFVLVATITPSNATNQEVVWVTSDANVATVENGHIKAVGGGNCEITATVDDVTATCVVTVIDPRETFPFSVSVNGEDLEATYVGTEKCNTSGERALYEVTVPADATSMMIYYDGEAMIIQNEADKAKLAQNVAEYEVDLTAGYEKLCIREDNRIRYHLAINVAEPEAPIAPGYTFATSADVTAENGGTATVHVKVTGHSDPSVTTYNAYDLTLTYDNTKLEFVSGEGADNSDQIKIEKKGDNQIQIVGVGAAKTFDVEVATLTFKTLEEGSADVTIDKVQVSNKSETVTEDVPEASAKHEEGDSSADETPSVSVVVVPYTVTKPGFVSGEGKVLHGETYTFSYTDTDNYTYKDLKVTVGGTEVTPTVENGVYTITNVTGAVVITATQTANSYDVTKPTNVTFSGPDQATYGTDYVFTLTANDGKVIDTVTVATENAPISYTINENGEYVIKGTDISGAFTITVTEKDKPQVVTTTISFTGVEASEVEGGLTQTAEVGKAFNFKLNKVENFTYTAMVGETVLTETEGQYTIPAELVVEGGVTVAITKTEISNLKVEVSPYFNADGSTMFLVIAKDGDKTLAYGDEAMFWSSKYALTNEEAGAYCWLISSADSAENVKAAAVAAIKAAEETVTAPAVAYDCDVNQTTKVDVNDAQLAYDMYMGSYGISESVTMDKFLEADMSTDKVLDVNDVAAIINVIVKGTAN